jgi:hypothetical protein
MPLVGVAILLGMYSGRVPAPPGDVPEPGSRGLLARDEDGTLRLTLAVPDGESTARCVVRDKDGTALLSLCYGRGRSLMFELAESPTLRAAGYRLANGYIGFGVASEGLKFEYEGRPGSPPVVELYSDETRRYARYRVTPGGSLILDPGAPEQ